MLEAIHERSLDELEALMVGFAQRERRVDDLDQDERRSNGHRSGSRVSTQVSIGDIFRQVQEDGARGSTYNENTSSHLISSTGSVFVPSIDSR
jgi:hypothetical protein